MAPQAPFRLSMDCGWATVVAAVSMMIGSGNRLSTILDPATDETVPHRKGSSSFNVPPLWQCDTQ